LRTICAADKEGFPHTLADLNAWYVEPPAGQNAASFVSEGIKVLHTANLESSGVPLLGRGKLPALGSPMPASVKSSIGALVAANREALQLFAQATKYEHSRYPVDLSLGAEAPCPHLNRMKEACQVLELAALWHVEANDPKSAANEIASALALANSLKLQGIPQAIAGGVCPFPSVEAACSAPSSATSSSMNAEACAFVMSERVRTWR
jgi:hypothetical protein